MTLSITSVEPTATRDSSQVFPALDAVRAVGALMVLVTHVAFWTGSYGFDVWGTFLSRLDSGVALFFVLSGFLLSRPFILRARGGKQAPSVGRYMWKRGLRVLPVYWLAAALAVVFVRDNAGSGAWDKLRILTMTDIYFSDSVPAGITQTWSLATEVAFYVVLPAIMVMWNRATRGRQSDRAVVLLAMLATGVSMAWILATPSWLADRAPMHQQWLPTFAIWFVMGIALGHIHVHHVEHPESGGRRWLGWVPELGRQPGVCLVIASALLLVSSTPLAGPPILFAPTDFQLVTKTLFYAVVGGLVVLAAVCAPADGAFARTMSHPVARHLGQISYGVFCIHVLVLHFIAHVIGWEQFAGDFLRYLVLTLALSLVLAELIYRVLERPLARLRSLGAATPAATKVSGTTNRS